MLFNKEIFNKNRLYVLLHKYKSDATYKGGSILVIINK